MALPISYGIPDLMKASDLDIAMPEGTVSRQIRVTPSNLSSIVSPTYTVPSTGRLTDQVFNSQNIYFDIPCLPNSWIDTRQSTVSFRAIYETVTAGNLNVIANAALRGGGYAFFDGLQVLGPAGNILESCSELGLVYNLLTEYAMSNSDRDGVGIQYGFQSTAQSAVVGHSIDALVGTLAVPLSQSTSYSFPLLSSIIGSAASKAFPIGNVPKLQVILSTTNLLPITMTATSATAAGTFRVTLTDMVLNLQYITLPPAAQNMIESSLSDGKYYIQGNAYRVASSTLPAAITGFSSVISGIRASSLKSVFFAFNELATTNVWGKYSSKNPCVSHFAFNANGLRYPSLPVEAYLHPARVLTELQRAMGSFNSTELKCVADTARFCVLSTGAAARSYAVATPTRDSYWENTANGDSVALGQACFYFGVDTEDVNKKGVLSGLNINSSQVFLEVTMGETPTSSHSVYSIGMLDAIYVVDARTGNIDVRL